MAEIIDTFGVPEYFATTTQIENAGDGCVRIYNCIKRGGVVIPVCTVIFPVSSVLKIVDATRDFAQTLPLTVMEGGAVH